MRDICYVELFLEITFYSFYRHKGVGSSKVFFFLFQSINFFFSLSNLFDIHIEFTQLVKRSEPYSHFCNTDHTREPVFDYTNSQFSPPPPSSPSRIHLNRMRFACGSLSRMHAWLLIYSVPKGRAVNPLIPTVILSRIYIALGNSTIHQKFCEFIFLRSESAKKKKMYLTSA